MIIMLATIIIYYFMRPIRISIFSWLCFCFFSISLNALHLLVFWCWASFNLHTRVPHTGHNNLFSIKFVNKYIIMIIVIIFIGFLNITIFSCRNMIFFGFPILSCFISAFITRFQLLKKRLCRFLLLKFIHYIFTYIVILFSLFI